MTSVIGQDNILNIFINNPEEPITNLPAISLKSQFSQVAATLYNPIIVEETTRYVWISVEIDNLYLATDNTNSESSSHLNGYYTWTMGKYSDIIKLIFDPGGENGVTEYTSNNENREADVFYRPEY